MSPSTKERLRKNLETFGSERNSVQPPEVQMAFGVEPPPITQMPLPHHTKNAYKQNAGST